MTSEPHPEFHLLVEPWIPVRWANGGTGEVSLGEAVLQSRKIAEIAEASPPNLVALHRLLLALLHRALAVHYGKWRDADRARWFREGLPQEAIRIYLDRWSDRFWLFHPTHPFLQAPFLAEDPETRDRPKPWAKLALEAASGNTPVLFDHALDDRPREIPAGVCARALLGLLQFTPGGLVKVLKGSDNAGPLANTSAALPLGENLEETLLLGLEPYSSEGAGALPGWEVDPPSKSDVLADPAPASGASDRYTRRARSVLLLREPSGRTVRRVLFAAGVALKEDPLAPDPMASYRFTAKGVPVRLTFSLGRESWRDLPSMLPAPAGVENRPASILGWAASLFEALGDWDRQARILVAGVASDQAKLLRWRSEQIRLPQSLLRDPLRADLVRSELSLAETAFASVRGVLAELIAHSMPDSEHKETRSRAFTQCDDGPARSAYFTLLERRFQDLLDAAGSGDKAAGVTCWRATIGAAATLAWKAQVETLGRSSRVLRAEARVWPKLQSAMRRAGVYGDQPRGEESR